MHEMDVSGEIKTIAAREGSSGIFTGSIEGLYQGYRFGSTTPDEREFVIEPPNGTIALLLRQQIVTPLPPRREKHPFADGRDPFDDPPAFLAEAFGGGPPAGHGGPPGGGGPPDHGGPPGAGGHGGPPGAGGPPDGPPGAGGPPEGGAPPGGGPPGAGGPPGGGAPPGPPGGDAPGMEGGQEIFKRVHYMETKLHVVPEKCTGIFAGSTGEMEFIAPNYRMAGYLVIDTEHGDLRMDFMEAGTRETLNADLWVNGDESTGAWSGAEGELKFALEVTPPFFGRGPYSGTIRVENELPG